MSLDELRADLQRNIAHSNIVTDDQTRAHLQNTLWPFLEALLETIEEIDDAVVEIVDQQEDYIQPETAAVFAAVIQFGLQMGVELKKRAAGDAAVLNMIAQHEQLCAQAVETLGAITMIPTEGEEQDDDEDEDEADQGDGAANE